MGWLKFYWILAVGRFTEAGWGRQREFLDGWVGGIYRWVLARDDWVCRGGRQEGGKRVWELSLELFIGLGEEGEEVCLVVGDGWVERARRWKVRILKSFC